MATESGIHFEQADKVKRIPPYILGVVKASVAEARKRGDDVIDFGMGNPDGPTPAHIVEKLVEASRIDGAGPFRFFFDTLLPLSRTNMAALFVILFIYGWNQYLWPLLITTRDDMQTIVIGIKKMIVTSDALTEWQLVMATAMLAMLPPVFVVIAMQKLFVRGLVETEK